MFILQKYGMQMANWFPPLLILLETLSGSPADCDGDLEDEDQQSPLTQPSVSSEMVAPELAANTLWLCQQTQKCPDYF